MKERERAGEGERKKVRIAEERGEESTFISITIFFIKQNAFSVSLSIRPLSLIHVSIDVVHCAKSISFSIPPFSSFQN
jgi:hypothetical protein